MLCGLLHAAGAGSQEAATAGERARVKAWEAEIAKRRYAVIIDEAHSSQTGETARELKVAFSGTVRDPDTGVEHTEPGMNADVATGRPIGAAALPARFGSSDYQVLLVVNKYQTGSRSSRGRSSRRCGPGGRTGTSRRRDRFAGHGAPAKCSNPRGSGSSLPPRRRRTVRSFVTTPIGVSGRPPICRRTCRSRPRNAGGLVKASS